MTDQSKVAGSTAIVIGVGPLEGLGARLCTRFAASGHHVVVAGRTEASLTAVAEAIAADGGSASIAVTDATDEAAVQRLFQEAPGPVALAIYNVGNNTPGRIIDMDIDYFRQSLQLGPEGGFLFGREAVRHMVRSGGGTLLFTGASASLRGRPNFGAFNASKGALRNLAQAMAKEYASDGIHVGHVVIDGPIGGEKIKTRFPEYAQQLGEDGMINLDGIVDAYQYLHQQPRAAWSFELDVRTSKEQW